MPSYVDRLQWNPKITEYLKNGKNVFISVAWSRVLWSFPPIHSNWGRGYRSLYYYSTVDLFTISEILAVIK